jgi:hypothetical protein
MTLKNEASSPDRMLNKPEAFLRVMPDFGEDFLLTVSNILSIPPGINSCALFFWQPGWSGVYN